MKKDGLLRKAYLSPSGFGRKLRELRSYSDMTLSDLAERAGIISSSINNYSCGAALPKNRHDIEAMAQALGVVPEALTVYNLGDGWKEAMSQLSDIYGFERVSDLGGEYLEPDDGNGFMRGFIGDWSAQRERYLKGDIPLSAYRRWRDVYEREFEPSMFPRRYELAYGEWRPIEEWVVVQFASTLRRLRKTAGMRQAELAEKVGMTIAQISNYEQGRRVPMRSTAHELETALEAPEGSLLIYDFGSPLQACHALFQFEDEVGIEPSVEHGRALIRITGEKLDGGAGGYGSRCLSMREENEMLRRRVRYLESERIPEMGERLLENLCAVREALADIEGVMDEAERIFRTAIEKERRGDNDHHQTGRGEQQIPSTQPPSLYQR